MKIFLYRHYVKIAIVIIAALILLELILEPFPDWQPFLMILGAILSSVYFIQKQKLEETRLLKELFTEFTGRYDQMNEPLNRILRQESGSNLSQEDIDLLYNYFNLCGEEYFYYQQGYVHPKVWKAWRNGMKIFYKNERIRKTWPEELENDSYYGFQLSELENE
jgi:hypothetical protein